MSDACQLTVRNDSGRKRCPGLSRLGIVAMLLVASWKAPPLQCGETIFVRILVDEEEATNESAWRRRLAERVAAASAVLHRAAGVRFVPREFGRWRSDNGIQDFSRSLSEFEQRAPLGRSAIAIGFSSQYRFSRGNHRLGGTRGPMRHHILIRENAPNILERERMEVLVHELGHYLGAAHSGESWTVMRPVVGDGQARSLDFPIQFDPTNQAIVRLVGGEIRRRNVTEYHQISPSTLAKLKPLYAKLVHDFPSDPSASRYVAYIDTLFASQRAPLPGTPRRSIFIRPKSP